MNIFMQVFDIWGDPTGNLAQEAALLSYVNTIPDGSIVMVSAYDSANPCKADCQEALTSLGGTGTALGQSRKNFALYKSEVLSSASSSCVYSIQST